MPLENGIEQNKTLPIIFIFSIKPHEVILCNLQILLDLKSHVQYRTISAVNK